MPRGTYESCDLADPVLQRGATPACATDATSRPRRRRRTAFSDRPLAEPLAE